MDPAGCVGMKRGEPRVAVVALRELHDLLVARGLRGNSSNDSDLVQEECDESELRDCSAAASDAGRDTASEQPVQLYFRSSNSPVREFVARPALQSSLRRQ
jgi:hypothetical protein